ncbi:MBL fold metallo-hydrolase [bacterium]|nr:MBL fold metallo-hydrolase [bacterium]
MAAQQYRYIVATRGNQGSRGPIKPYNRFLKKENALVLGLLFLTCLGFYPLLSSGQTSGEHLTGQDKTNPLSVVFFNVYQGDATLISTPSGKHILIDGGQGANKYVQFDGGLHVIVPYLKKHNITKLDQLVMTHPHADHLGGLMAVLDEIAVDEVLDPGMTYGSELYKRFLLTIERKNITWTEARAGMVLDWGPEIQAQVLSPKRIYRGTHSDPNNNSIVIKMIYQATHFLFTGDIESEVEDDLLIYRKQLRSNVLKVPHHGGEFSSTLSFVELIRPDIAVISCGKNNKFGHPHPKTLETYRSIGSRILRTDLCGTVTMISDGHEISFSTETPCQ